MTKTTAKPQIIATAPTANGFSIGILRRGSTYMVVRIDDEMRYFTLGRRTTERDARDLANIEWKKDMGR